jgi:hypothetical protein
VTEPVGVSLVRLFGRGIAAFSIPLIATAIFGAFFLLILYVFDSSTESYAERAYGALTAQFLAPSTPAQDSLAHAKSVIRPYIVEIAQSLDDNSNSATAAPILLLANKMDRETDWAQLLKTQTPQPIVVKGGGEAWPDQEGEFNSAFAESLLFPTITTTETVSEDKDCWRPLGKSTFRTFNYSSSCKLSGWPRIQTFITKLENMLRTSADTNPCTLKDFACRYTNFQRTFSNSDTGSVLQDALFVRRIYMYVAQGDKPGVIVNYPGGIPFCTLKRSDCDRNYQPTTRPWYIAIQELLKIMATQQTPRGITQQSGAEHVFDVTAEGQAVHPCILTRPYPDVAEVSLGTTHFPIVRTIACYLGTGDQRSTETNSANAYLMVDLERLALTTEAIKTWWYCLPTQSRGSSPKLLTDCIKPDERSIPPAWLTGQLLSSRNDSPPPTLDPRSIARNALAPLLESWNRHRAIALSWMRVFFVAFASLYFVLKLQIERSAKVFVRRLLPASKPTDDKPFQGASLTLSGSTLEETELGSGFGHDWMGWTTRLNFKRTSRRETGNIRKIEDQAALEYQKLRSGSSVSLIAIKWQLVAYLGIRWRKSARSLLIRNIARSFGAIELLSISTIDSSPILTPLDTFGRCGGENALALLNKRHPSLHSDLLNYLLLHIPSDQGQQPRHSEGSQSVFFNNERFASLQSLKPFQLAARNIRHYTSGHFFSRNLLGVMESAEENFGRSYRVESVIDGRLLRKILKDDALQRDSRFRSAVESWLEIGDETRRLVVVDSQETAEILMREIGDIDKGTLNSDIVGAFRWLPSPKSKASTDLSPAFRDFALIKDGDNYRYCLVTQRVFLRRKLETIEGQSIDTVINFEGYVSVREAEIDYAKVLFANWWNNACENLDDALRRLETP